MNDGNMVTTEQHIEVIHRFYQVEKASFEEMTAYLLTEYLATYMPVRMVFFGAPADNSEYIAQFDYLRKTVKKFFGDKQPIVSYVAQPVDTGGMAMEIHELVLTGQDMVTYQKCADIPYIVVERKGYKRLFWEELPEMCYIRIFVSNRMMFLVVSDRYLILSRYLFLRLYVNGIILKKLLTMIMWDISIIRILMMPVLCFIQMWNGKQAILPLQVSELGAGELW